MKIRYAFANKEVVEIEVDDAWGNLVIDLDRQEYNNDHAETRRHASLESMPYEGDYFIDERADFCGVDDAIDLRAAIATLPPRQREVIQLYYFGQYTLTQIAEKLGIRHPTVHEALKAGIKKLKKFL